METTLLGKSGLTVTRTGFGALPLQRASVDEADTILARAVEAGITFFDTARAYTDSEAKIARGLSRRRDAVVLATKTLATTREGVLGDLKTSLEQMQVDYVDLLQLHNPKSIPDFDDPESAYAGLIEARETGLTRAIGVTQHSRERAEALVDSGLYDTLQFPLCHLSNDEDLALIDRCRKANMGIIAMKPLSGGLLTQLRPAFAFLRQFENVVPIWGIQHLYELDELLECDANPPALDDEMMAHIERDRQELGSEFCRGCGYCLPCDQGIPIFMAARMALVMKRMPYQQFLSAEWQEKMRRIELCTECGQCRARCPYDLDPPAMLRKSLVDYEAFLQDHA